MSEHRYDPPPAANGETHSYLGGRSEKPVHVTRIEETLLEFRYPESPGTVVQVIQEGNLFHVIGNNSLGALNLEWNELLELH
jgi:hypothetical protein